jgi:hypothetical protein
VQDLFNVKVVFLSANATVVMHPVDTGIIESCTMFAAVRYRDNYSFVDFLRQFLVS